MELLQKHRYYRNNLAFLKYVRPLLEEMLTLDLHEQIAYNMQYVLRMTDHDAQVVLNRLTVDLPEKLKGEVMTAAEQLMQQDMQQGLQEGKQEVAKNLMTSGHSIDFIAQMTGLSSKQLEAL